MRLIRLNKIPSYNAYKVLTERTPDVGKKIYFDRPWAVELAKIKLREIFNDPLAEGGIRTEVVIRALRQGMFTRSEIKTARKELGIVSEIRSGVRFWAYPDKTEG